MPRRPTILRMPASTQRLDPDLELAADFPAASEDEWRALVGAVLRKSGVCRGCRPDRGVEHDDLRRHRDPPALHRQDPRPAVPRVPARRRVGRAHVASATRTRRRRTLRCSTISRPGRPRCGCVSATAGSPIDDLGDGARRRVRSISRRSCSTPATGSATPRRAFLELRRARSHAADVRGSLGADPIGLACPHRRRRRSRRSPTLVELARPLPELRIATVDATVYHDAGACDATEIGGRHRGRRRPTCARSPTPDCRSTTRSQRLEFRFAVTADQFASIAKLRAARQVWERVAELCGVDDARAAPARGDVGGDDDPPRPVGEHAAHDDRLLRRGGRRCGRDHGAAVRHRDRAARRLRAPHRPQHPRRAARRVEPRPRGRRRRRVVVRRVASPTSWPSGVGRSSPRSSGPAARSPRSTTGRSPTLDRRDRATRAPTTSRTGGRRSPASASSRCRTSAASTRAPAPAAPTVARSHAVR